jgi:hypothetical protein
VCGAYEVDAKVVLVLLAAVCIYDIFLSQKKKVTVFVQGVNGK